MERISIPMGHGHKANRERQMHRHSKHKQMQRFTRGKQLTQFYVLIISENKDDVGSDIAYVAVPLRARPDAISRQVPRALGRREDSHKD